MNAPPQLERFELRPAPGERIVGDRLLGATPNYLFLHGLGSVRAGEKSTALLAHARTRGRGCLRFDFRGHGESTGRIGHATISELIGDTHAILDGNTPAILVGSSLGGLVAAFVAAARPADVVGLVLIAPALGFLPRMERRLHPAGRLRTSQDYAFTVDPRVLADARQLDEELLPTRLPMPVLIAHGTADDTVPPVLSERFFAAIPHPRKELWLVPGGDHRLNQPIAAIWRRMDALLG